jgi:hypothetical protein
LIGVDTELEKAGSFFPLQEKGRPLYRGVITVLYQGNWLFLKNASEIFLKKGIGSRKTRHFAKAAVDVF